MALTAAPPGRRGDGQLVRTASRASAMRRRSARSPAAGGLHDDAQLGKPRRPRRPCTPSVVRSRRRVGVLASPPRPPAPCGRRTARRTGSAARETAKFSLMSRSFRNMCLRGALPVRLRSDASSLRANGLDAPMALPDLRYAEPAKPGQTAFAPRAEARGFAAVLRFFRR